MKSLDLLVKVIRVSEHGVRMITGAPKIIQVLAKYRMHIGEDQPIDDQTRLSRAEEMASLADSESSNDFPVLHSFAVVAIWSWLEHLVKNFIALWLVHRLGATDAASVQRLKVRLGEYISLAPLDQAKYVVELLESDLATPLKRGVGRFHTLLEPFDLAFKLPEGLSETLFEMQQVRNAVAHSSGRADQRLRSSCPWLKYKLNQRICISTEQLSKYADGAAQYCLCLLYRLGEIDNIELRPINETPNP